MDNRKLFYPLYFVFLFLTRYYIPDARYSLFIELICILSHLLYNKKGGMVNRSLNFSSKLSIIANQSKG